MINHYILKERLKKKLNLREEGTRGGDQGQRILIDKARDGSNRGPRGKSSGLKMSAEKLLHLNSLRYLKGNKEIER